MTEPRVLLRKAEVVGLLERLCQALELTDSQYRTARERYEGVGAWLADAESDVLRALVIYLQGSTALGTTVKPIGENEHDVDLVAHIPNLGTWIAPAAVKNAIGQRLRANGHYAPQLKEKSRCWRLDYANEFHLDITPSIPNPACNAGGELVPDKALRQWTASNPKGYRSLFDRRASLVPRMRALKAFEGGVRADVETYPAPSRLKGILRRVVQIAKRHRDQYFLNHDPSFAPISVIVTTLASQSYEYCVGRASYDGEFDLLLDVLRCMPAFIESRVVGGQTNWFIWNESTTGENFAEKWNRDPRLAEAFWVWHADALTDLERLPDADGIDNITKHLRESFGSGPADAALAGLTKEVSTARATGQLRVAPGIGLTALAADRASKVRPNTFFGSD
jgi:Second Messenger Oligonucleotide or Dinucleotide Synthetase domain